MCSNRGATRHSLNRPKARNVSLFDRPRDVPSRPPPVGAPVRFLESLAAHRARKVSRGTGTGSGRQEKAPKRSGFLQLSTRQPLMGGFRNSTPNTPLRTEPFPVARRRRMPPSAQTVRSGPTANAGQRGFNSSSGRRAFALSRRLRPHPYCQGKVIENECLETGCRYPDGAGGCFLRHNENLRSRNQRRGPPEEV